MAPLKNDISEKKNENRQKQLFYFKEKKNTFMISRKTAKRLRAIKNLHHLHNCDAKSHDRYNCEWC